MRTFAITFISYISYQTKSNLSYYSVCFRILYQSTKSLKRHRIFWIVKNQNCLWKLSKQLMKICSSPLIIPCLVRVRKVGKLSVQQRVREPQQDMKCGGLWCKFNKLPQRCPSVTVQKFVALSLQGFYCFWKTRAAFHLLAALLHHRTFTRFQISLRKCFFIAEHKLTEKTKDLAV